MWCSQEDDCFGTVQYALLVVLGVDRYRQSLSCQLLLELSCTFCTLTFSQTSPLRLCPYKTRIVSHMRQSSEEIYCVLSDLVLPCLSQELHNIRIIAEGRDPSFWYISRE